MLINLTSICKYPLSKKCWLAVVLMLTIRRQLFNNYKVTFIMSTFKYISRSLISEDPLIPEELIIAWVSNDCICTITYTFLSFNLILMTPTQESCCYPVAHLRKQHRKPVSLKQTSYMWHKWVHNQDDGTVQAFSNTNPSLL